MHPPPCDNPKENYINNILMIQFFQIQASFQPSPILSLHICASATMRPPPCDNPKENYINKTDMLKDLEY